MEKYVWGKSTEDSLKVRDYYERHRENYKWRERVRASIVSTDSASLLPELEKGLKKDTVQFFSQTIELEGDSITENLTERIKRISIEFSKVPDSKVQLEYNPTLINEQTISSIQNILTKNGISEDDVLIIENKELSLTLIFDLFSCSKKVLEYLYNNNSALTMNVKEGLFEKQDHDVLSRIEWQTGIQKWKDRERFYFVRIDSVYGETTMDFKEVRGRVISDYQNELEKQWIDNLKIKYPVSINESVLNKTIKYFEKK